MFLFKKREKIERGGGRRRGEVEGGKERRKQWGRKVTTSYMKKMI